MRLQANNSKGAALIGLTWCSLVLAAPAAPATPHSSLHLQRFRPMSIDSKAVVSNSGGHKRQQARSLAAGTAPAPYEFVTANDTFFQVTQHLMLL